MSRVSIVGTGYVGLVTGACLAELGHQVVCVDVNHERVATINAGRTSFHEPGLDDLVRSHAGSKLVATLDVTEAVSGSDFIFLAVGTPSDPSGAIDLTQVKSAAEKVGAALANSSQWHVVVIKSTVIPGSTVDQIIPILESASGKKAGIGFGVVVNPEFLTEGTALSDFMLPDRIVLGGSDEKSLQQVKGLYRAFDHVPFVLTNPGGAEMIKYASNTLLATLISFSNEIADIGSAIGGIDVAEVMEGVALSRYLTSEGERAPIASFIEAGCGFGGSCLPKDTAALLAEGARAGADANLLRAVLDVNRARPQRLVDLIRRHTPDLNGVTVAVLGLAFKPDTDDVRESPSLPVISLLLAAGAVVITHDPVVHSDSMPAELRTQVRHIEDLPEVIRVADILVIMTRWSEYLKVPELLAGLDSPPLVIDGRRMLTPDSVPRYDGIGLGSDQS